MSLFCVIQEPDGPFKTIIEQGAFIPEGWSVVAESKTLAEAQAIATPIGG